MRRDREKKQGHSSPLFFACDRGHKRLLCACLYGVVGRLFEKRMLTDFHLYCHCCAALADARTKWSTILNPRVVLVVAMVVVVTILTCSGIFAK
jgi:hypothetical protein